MSNELTLSFEHLYLAYYSRVYRWAYRLLGHHREAAEDATQETFLFKSAGSKPVGKAKGGLIVLQLLPRDMPPALPAHWTQLALFEQKEMEVSV